MSEEGRQRPLDSVRIGNIEAAIWPSKDNLPPNVGLVKHYKDAHGEWQTTNSLNMDDVPVAIKTLDKAMDLAIEIQRARYGARSRPSGIAA